MESIIDSSRLKIDPISLENKNKTMYIKYNFQSLLIKSPVMTSPQGVFNVQNSYYLDLLFDDDNYESYIFYQWIVGFESKIKELVLELNPNLTSDNFVSCLKKDYISTNKIRTKIDNRNNKLSLEIYSKKEDDKSIDKLKDGKMYSLLKCQPIWEMNNKWGYSWRLQKIFIKEISPLNTYAFVDTQEDKNILEIEKDLNDSADIYFKNFYPVNETVTDYIAPDVNEIVEKQFKKIKKNTKK